jgi:alpha-D-xyloside xylohydrolase
MKQTNYLLFDFMDFDPSIPPGKSKRRLWKACRPIGFEEKEDGVIIHIPFQCQLPGNDLAPDLLVERFVHKLAIKAYGEKILRLTLEMDKPRPEVSEILEAGLEDQIQPLKVEQHPDLWLVKDANGNTRARFDFKPAATDHWSDLLPRPEESLEAAFYPDGKKAVHIHAYDQFFPARNDAMAMAYVAEKDEIIADFIPFYILHDGLPAIVMDNFEQNVRADYDNGDLEYLQGYNHLIINSSAPFLASVQQPFVETRRETHVPAPGLWAGRSRRLLGRPPPRPR